MGRGHVRGTRATPEDQRVHRSHELPLWECAAHQTVGPMDCGHVGRGGGSTGGGLPQPVAGGGL